MKISEEIYNKEDLLEFKQASMWMIEGADMLLEVIAKEETGQEVSRLERIEAKVMMDKGAIAMHEHHKAFQAKQRNNMNRKQRRNFNQPLSKSYGR